MIMMMIYHDNDDYFNDDADDNDNQAFEGMIIIVKLRDEYRFDRNFILPMSIIPTAKRSI